MSFDLTNKNIQDTFQNLLQKTGSDNRLYDLKGNEVGDLRISGSLIAQQYVVSSSVTNLITQTKSGSTQFGDSADDTHLFTGNITASGNISASGTIYANNFASTGGDVGGVTFADDVNITGHITASGNLQIPDNSFIHIGDNTDLKLFHNGSNSFIQENSGDLVLIPDGTNKKLLVSGSGDTKLSVEGNITASGNISGSSTSNITVGGTITAEQLTSTDGITATGNISSNAGSLVLTAGKVVLGATPQIDVGASRAVTFSVNPNAPTIFSNSSAVSASNFTTDGHITASGNISSSGTINANNVQINGAGVVSNVAAAATQGRLTQTKDGLGGAVDLTDLGTTGNPTFNNITADTDILVARNILHVGDTSTQIGFDGGKITNNANQIVLNGPVTASGDISASGDFYSGNNKLVKSSQTGSFLTSIPDGTYSSSLQTLGNITSSGDISASGTGVFNKLQVDDTTRVTNLNADKLDGQHGSHYLDFSNFIIDDNEIPIAKLASDAITIGGAGSTTLGGTATVANILQGSTVFSSSAQLPSGLVSASSAGDGQAQFKLNGTNVDVNGLGTNGDVTFDTLTLDAGGLKGVGTFSSSAQLPSGIFSSSLQTFTNITASGNISASGTITSNGGTFTGDIILNADNKLKSDTTGTNNFLEFDNDDGSPENQTILSSVTNVALIVDGNGNGTGQFEVLKAGTDSTATELFRIENDGDTVLDGDFRIQSGHKFNVAGNDVLDQTTLGSTVVNSSLTSVGTLTGLNVDGHITASNNISASGTLIANAITLPDNAISGDKVEGGTIASITISQLGGALDVNNENITNVDINSGTIDGTDVTVGSGKTLDVSGGTLTLANNQISGDKVEGGTIASITISELGGALDANNQNITNIDIDSGAIDGTVIGGNSAAAGTFTDLTATKLNVTHLTSSFITASTIETHGSHIFGDSISDTQELRGHITASGNISASGNINATSITAAGTPIAMTAVGNINAQGNIIGDNNTNMSGINNITSSGNISSSGYVYGDRFYVDGRLGLDYNSLDGIRLGYQTDEPIRIGRTITSRTTFTGNITASGDISASGTATVQNLNVVSPAGNIKIGENVAGNLDGIALEKNISSSMNLYLEGDIRDVQHITASGNISGSATSNLTLGGDVNIVKDKLKIGGVAVTTTAAELNFLDTAAANSVVNSKAVIYGSSGELAGTLSTAAQGNVTSLGTLTTLTVDDITINASKISDSSTLEIEAGGGLNLDTAAEILLDSAAKRIRAIGHITASGDISASGNLSATGNLDIDGTSNFASHITASGNISASGTINSNQVLVKGETALSLLSPGGATKGFVFSDAQVTKLQIGKGDTVTETTINGHITASGEISSSGGLTTLSVAESTLTSSLKPVQGTFNIHYGTNAQFTGSLTAAGGYGEIMSNFAIHTEVDKGDICYNIGGTWRLADADSETSTTKMLGVALANGMSTVGQPVLIRGVARLKIGHINDTSGDEGDLLYLSNTGGKVQFAAPSDSGEFVRIVGYCLQEANDIIYFDPDKSFVEVA